MIPGWHLSAWQGFSTKSLLEYGVNLVKAYGQTFVMITDNILANDQYSGKKHQLQFFPLYPLKAIRHEGLRQACIQSAGELLWAGQSRGRRGCPRTGRRLLNRIKNRFSSPLFRSFRLFSIVRAFLKTSLICCHFRTVLSALL
jgi:hypothetical protein